ncbi:MAG: hypothetical protein QXV32_04505 [Conexivisphaerales archaeon]
MLIVKSQFLNEFKRFRQNALTTFKYTICRVGLEKMLDGRSSCLSSLFALFLVLSTGIAVIVPVPHNVQSFAQPVSLRYNLQMGEAFIADTPSLAYNITAIAQNNSLGFGPAYLLNGLTDSGYWYQAGVAYNWYPGFGGGTGFSFIYAVFAPNGSIVFPQASNSAGLQPFAGTVNNGDLILVTMTIGNGSSAGFLFMSAYDWNTGATALVSYRSFNATVFLGRGSAPEAAHGFFTGLMTEQYFSGTEISNPKFVSYTSTKGLDSSYMFIDMTDRLNNSVIFQTERFVTLQDGNVQELKWSNLTEFSTTFGFYTGDSKGQTFSPPVVNTSKGYSQPSGNNTQAFQPIISSTVSMCSGSQTLTGFSSFFSNGTIVIFSNTFNTEVNQELRLCYLLTLPPQSNATLHWLVNSTETLSQNYNSSVSVYNYTFLPSSPGLYLVTVVVDMGQKTFQALPLSISVSPKPWVREIAYNPASNTLFVNVSGGVAPFRYTWFLNGRNYTVTTVPYLELPNSKTSYAYVYVQVQDAFGSSVLGFYIEPALFSSLLRLVALLIAFLIISFLLVYLHSGRSHHNNYNSK